jgi:hypothetical protein
LSLPSGGYIRPKIQKFIRQHGVRRKTFAADKLRTAHFLDQMASIYSSKAGSLSELATVVMTAAAAATEIVSGPRAAVRAMRRPAMKKRCRSDKKMRVHIRTGPDGQKAHVGRAAVGRPTAPDCNSKPFGKQAIRLVGGKRQSAIGASAEGRRATSATTRANPKTGPGLPDDAAITAAKYSTAAWLAAVKLC